MVLLSVSELHKSFGGDEVLSSVSFSVMEGDRLGVVGVNGAGKSTLLRILAGQLAPDAGEVFFSRGKSYGFLSQSAAEEGGRNEESLLSHMEAAFPALLAAEREISSLEGAIAALGEAGDRARIASLSAALDEAHRRFSEAGGLSFRGRCRSMLLRLGFSEGELERPVSSLSGGQTTRLALARLLAQELDLLLLDEPTNHLDTEALLWLEEFLASYKKTIILVSHDRYFLDRVTNKTLHIAAHRATLYPAPYSRARQMEEEGRASLEHRRREQQKEIAHIQKNIEFQRRCGQEHNFVTIRAKEKQLSRMEKIELAPPPPRDIRLSFLEEECPSRDILEVKGISFSYGEKPLIEGLDFLIRNGERVFFLGPNGCGKSTLLQILTERLSPRQGSIRRAPALKIGYYDQENRTLCETNTVFSEMREAYPRKTDGELRSTLALFNFGAEDMDKPVAVLSGGERARLTFSKLVLSPVNLLVLDEPTNHLDIGSREVLEGALSRFSGTVVAVSHDRYFINRVATRFLEIDPAAAGGCVDYPLSAGEDAFAEYRRLREARQAGTAPVASPQESDGRRRYEEGKRAAAEKRAAERRLAEAERKIPRLEEEIEALTAELFGPAAADYVRAAELEARRTALEEELLALYELTMG